MEKEPQNSVIFFNNTEAYTETPERKPRNLGTELRVVQNCTEADTEVRRSGIRKIFPNFG
jgi:hypothetical protein